MVFAISLIIVALTIYALVKQYETRMVLFCSGLLLATISGDPFVALKGFSHAMTQAKLFEAIVSVMGFAMVLKATECDKHLIYLLARSLKHACPLLIPGTVLVTLFVNTSITSGAGCSAAVGAIMIPFLISAGIHPAMAASAVVAGTYGANFNPGFSQIVIIADVAKASPTAVVANHFWAMLACGVIGAVSLFVIARIRKEHCGYVLPADQRTDTPDFKVDYTKAIIPVLPIILLMASSTGYIPALKKLPISHAMIIGVFAAFIVTRTNPGKISAEFWRGVGEAFGHIFGIITCALIFVDGMKAVGLIDALIRTMLEYPTLAKVSSVFGPFILALICGSSDAAAVSFNKSVTIHAADFGIAPIDMGSAVAIGAALGRTMSPLAGLSIIAASIAGVSPLELTKRNMPGMIVAAVVLMFIMLF